MGPLEFNAFMLLRHHGPRVIHATTLTRSRQIVQSPHNSCYNIHMITPPRSFPARSMLQNSQFTDDESCHLVPSLHDSARNYATPENSPTSRTGTHRHYTIL
ncbi:Uncharacterized protein Rs2_21415 [Raphanus sativus]|nr:Uncharacterized protein Rs2_21415 [Raphanus sativus]